MDRPVRYHPLFDRDVREAAGWYDQRAAGLGDAFVEVVRLPRFPYVVLFDLVDDELLMLGVLHTARSMQKWRERQHDI